MKKRQEIQQEINNLNQQLRQHRSSRERNSRVNSSSMDDMVTGTSNTSKRKTPLSQVHACDDLCRFFQKQAKVQGSMATQMQGRASVLESGNQTGCRKGNIEKKGRRTGRAAEAKGHSQRQQHRCLHLQMQINQ